MKLIIDIQDFVYNHIKEFNSTRLYELNVVTAIKNGTPLEEELNNIKAEINEVPRAWMPKSFINKIFNNHITENRKER